MRLRFRSSPLSRLSRNPVHARSCSGSAAFRVEVLESRIAPASAISAGLLHSEAIEPHDAVTLVSHGNLGTAAPVTGAIANADSQVSVTVSPSSVIEDGSGNLTYTFTRSGALTEALTVNFTAGGSASLASDYTQTGAVTFTI